MLGPQGGTIGRWWILQEVMPRGMTAGHWGVPLQSAPFLPLLPGWWCEWFYSTTHYRPGVAPPPPQIPAERPMDHGLELPKLRQNKPFVLKVNYLRYFITVVECWLPQLGTILQCLYIFKWWFYSFILIFFFLVVVLSWTQGPVLAREALYHFSHLPALLTLVIFELASCFMSRQA
jgi:hypothetical protein